VPKRAADSLQLPIATDVADRAIATPSILLIAHAVSSAAHLLLGIVAYLSRRAVTARQCAIVQLVDALWSAIARCTQYNANSGGSCHEALFPTSQ
jgi:hypothetical protein